MDYIAIYTDGSKATTLSHHGIKDQKWGVRRFQNPDGTLTEEGRRRYGVGKSAKIKAKADKYSAKSMKYAFKAQKAYDRYNVEKSNKYNDKSARYAVKSAELRAKASSQAVKEDRLINTKLKTSDVYALEGAKKAGLLGAAAGKMVGVYKEHQEKRAERFKKENEEVENNSNNTDGETSEQLWERLASDPSYITVKDKSNSGSGGNALVKIEDKSSAATSLRYLGYSDKEIASLLETPIDKVLSSGLESSGKAGYTREKPEKSSGRYTTGSKSWVEEAANDPEHWELIDDTPGERLYKRRDPPKSSGRYKTGAKESSKTENTKLAYLKLHNEGYKPSEIAKRLGQSTKDDGKPSGEIRKMAAKYKINKNEVAFFKGLQRRAQSLKSSGKTIAEIADIMGVSVPSIKDYLYEDFDSLR